MEEKDPLEDSREGRGEDLVADEVEEGKSRSVNGVPEGKGGEKEERWTGRTWTRSKIDERGDQDDGSAVDVSLLVRL